MKAIKTAARGLQRLAHWINWVAETVATAALALILGSLLFTIVSRYFFRVSAPWASEIVAYTIAVVGTVGFSCLVHRRKLLAITFLRDKLPLKGAQVFDMLIWIGFIVYFQLFITHGVVFAENVRGQYSPSLTFHLYHMRLIIPVGGALIVFQSVNNLIQDVLGFGTAPAKVEVAKEKD